MKRKGNIPLSIEPILGQTPAVSSRNAMAYELTLEELATQFKPRDVIEWLLVRDAAYYACQTTCWRELAAAIIINGRKKPATANSTLPPSAGQKMVAEMRPPLEAAETFLGWIAPYERAQDCVQTAERRFLDALRHLCEYRQAGGLRDVLLAPQTKTIEGSLATEPAPTAIADGTASRISAASLNGTERVPAEGEAHSDTKANG